MASVIGDLLVRLGVDAAALERGLGTAEKRIERFGTQLFFAGSRITAGITVPLVAAGAAVAKYSLEFDNAMTESLAIMNDVGPRMRDQMEEVALSISKTSKFSATEGAQGFYYLASAGLSAAESMQALPIATTFAQAGVMDLAKATEFLAGAQAALGNDSQTSAEKVAQMAEVADVLTEANNRALGTVQDFAEALTNKSGAAMRQFGISVQEGVAVLAAYASQNVKGRLAGQQFMMMVRDLTTYAIKNADAFAKYKIRVFDATGELRNMADVIADVERATEKMNDAQITQMLMALKIPQRSIAATRALIGYSGAIRKNEEALLAAGGTAQRVADKQMESLKNQLLALYHQFQAAAIGIGKTFIPVLTDYLMPVARQVVVFIEKMGDALAKLPTWAKGAVLAFGGMVAAIGPLIMLVGSFILLGSQVMRVLAPMAGGFSTLATKVGLAAGGQRQLVLSTTQLALAQTAAGKAAYANAIAQGATWNQAVAAAKAQRAAVAATNAAAAANVAATAKISMLGRSLVMLTDVIKLIGARFFIWVGILALVYPMLQALIKGSDGASDSIRGLGDALKDASVGSKSFFQQFKDGGSILLDSVSIIQDLSRVVGEGIVEAFGGLKDIASTIGDRFAEDVFGKLDQPASKFFKNLDVYWQEALPAPMLWADTTRNALMHVTDPTLWQRFKLVAADSIETVNNGMKEVASKGVLGAIKDKTAEWANNLSLIVTKEETAKTLAQQLLQLYKDISKEVGGIKARELQPPKFGYVRSNPQKGTLETVPGNAAGLQAWGALFLDQSAYIKMWQRSLTEAEGTIFDVGETSESTAKKIQKMWDSFVGTGESDLAILQGVWEKHKIEILTNRTAAEAFVDEYIKLKKITHQTIPVFETLATSVGRVTTEETEAAKKAKEFGDIWGESTRDITKHLGTFIGEWKKLKTQGFEGEFWEKHSSSMEMLAKTFDRQSPGMQNDIRDIVRAYLEWKLQSKETRDQVEKDLNKARETLKSNADKIIAELEDKQDQIALFDEQYGNREVVGLKRGYARIKVEHDKIIKEMMDAAMQVGLMEFNAAAKKVTDVENASKEILRLTELEGSHRIAQAVGVSARLLRVWDTFKEERRNQIIEERKAWLKLMEGIEDYHNLVTSLGGLAASLGLDDLGRGLTAAATQAGAFNKGLEEAAKAGNTFMQRGAGIVTSLTAIVSMYNELDKVAGRVNKVVAGMTFGASVGYQIGKVVAQMSKLSAEASKVAGAWGAVAGAVAGIFIGWYKAGQEQKRLLAELKNQFIDTAGGIDALRAQAERAGFRIDDFFNNVLSKNVKEAEKQLKALGEALELRRLRESLLETHGGMYELAKKAALAGANLREALDAKTPLAFEAAVERINKAFEAQQRRLEGLKTAAQGLADEIKGFAQQIERTFKDKKITIEAPEKHPGKKGVGVIGANVDTKDIIKRLQMFGYTVNNIFLSIVRETGDVTRALDEVGPSLDELIALSKKLGITITDENTKWLMGLREIQKAHPDLMLQIQGLRAQIEGLGGAQRITQEQFEAFGTSAVQIYDDMIARGIPTRDALALMQPTLQALWEAQNKFGLKTDEATQKLIDMGIESGFINTEMKPDFQTLIDIMGMGTPGNPGLLGVLKLIAQELGVIFDNANKAGGAISNMPPPQGPYPGGGGGQIPGGPGGGGGYPGGPPGPNTPRPPNYPSDKPWPPEGYAAGGLVDRWSRAMELFRPKGSDTVPAMLSPGEYVVPKAAVDRMGVDFLDVLSGKTALLGGRDVDTAFTPPPMVRSERRSPRPGDGAAMPMDRFWAEMKASKENEKEVPLGGPNFTANITVVAHDTRGVKEFVEKDLKPELLNMWRGNRNRFRTETRDTLGIKD